MQDYKQEVKNIIRSFISKDLASIYVFGSRSVQKNNYRNNSDLDILLLNHEDIPGAIITYIEERFENSDLPFKVDVVLRSRITDDFFTKIKPSLELLD